MVRVQPNHGRAHRAVANTFGMQHAEVSVRSLESEWPFPIGCSVLPTAYCWKDCGLCCYSVCCPLCVHAELAEENEIKGFFGVAPCCQQVLSVLCLELLTFCCCSFVGCSPLCYVVRGAYYTQVRDGFKAKYGLPDDEFLFSYTMTTYMCWPCQVFACSSCAAYQMAYFMKYDAPIKSNFECCFYTVMCKPLCSPSED